MKIWTALENCYQKYSVGEQDIFEKEKLINKLKCVDGFQFVTDSYDKCEF